MNLRNYQKEIDIILEMIRDKTNHDDKIFVENKNEIDWENLFSLSIRHGILPNVYKRLKKLKKGTIPKDKLTKFKSVYFQIVQLNLIRANQLIKVIKLLKEKNIDMIPFKGPVLSLQAYGDHCFRISADLDILIKSDDMFLVYDTMISAGYKPFFPLSEKKKKIWRRAGRDFEFSFSNTVIDFHQRLTQGHSAFKITPEEMNEDNFVTMMDYKIRTLSPENTILAMCIHSTKERWRSLRMVSDLSYFLHSHPELDWDKLLQKAKKMGVLKIVLTGFSILKELINEKFPDDIEKKISENISRNEIYKKYIGKILSGKREENTSSRITSIVEALDSLIHQSKFLLNFLFSPTPEDFKFLSLPEFLYPLYRILRPIRLIRLSIKNNFTKSRSKF